MLDDAQIRNIWENSVKPRVFRSAVQEATPLTVFLGGQPGSGKTQAVSTFRNLFKNQVITPIIGDDLRIYHPEYLHFLKNDPLHMPDVTAQAAGQWIALCVDYANQNNISIVIEGTWRNKDTVLAEASRANKLGRITHAVALSVPPLITRVSILERFYRDVDSGKQTRWTPPQAHENTVKILESNVKSIAFSTAIDRFSVLSRTALLYDSETTKLPRRYGIEQWEGEFRRPITRMETHRLYSTLTDIENAARRLGMETSDLIEIRRQLN